MKIDINRKKRNDVILTLLTMVNYSNSSLFSIRLVFEINLWTFSCILPKRGRERENEFVLNGFFMFP